MTSIGALPLDILQHILSKLQDPDDLATAHLVDIRCVRLAEQAGALIKLCRSTLVCCSNHQDNALLQCCI